MMVTSAKNKNRFPGDLVDALLPSTGLLGQGDQNRSYETQTSPSQSIQKHGLRFFNRMQHSIMMPFTPFWEILFSAC